MTLSSICTPFLPSSRLNMVHFPRFRNYTFAPRKLSLDHCLLSTYFQFCTNSVCRDLRSESHTDQYCEMLKYDLYSFFGSARNVQKLSCLRDVRLTISADSPHNFMYFQLLIETVVLSNPLLQTLRFCMSPRTANGRFGTPRFFDYLRNYTSTMAGRRLGGHTRGGCDRGIGHNKDGHACQQGEYVCQIYTFADIS